MAKITFLGGADEVGASCSFVEMAGRRFVVDCGIRMGASAERLPDLSLLPHERPLDAIFLTHAHMDHCGALPLLHQSYPAIPVYMTAATLAITTTLLLDSLKIMQIEAEQEGEIPLYPESAVASLLEAVRVVPLGKPISLWDGEIKATFFPVGHILGATGIFFESNEATALLSGDISITDQVTIPGMKMLPLVSPDLVVVESTYGGRLHANRKAEEKRIVEQAREIIERKGIMLFPAFAVGRAQEVILILSRAMEKKEIPTVPLFVDGMVKQVCQIYRSYPELLTPWMRRRCDTLGHPFFYKDGPAVPVWEPKKRTLIAQTRPSIIVSSSGMLTGGPSQGYARVLATNPKDFIAITGYQDEEAPGRRIQEVAKAGGGSIRLGAEEIQLSCGVGTYSLSAHADTSQIVSFLSALQPHQIALVHGDAQARPALQEALQKAHLSGVHLPACGTVLSFERPKGSKKPKAAVSPASAKEDKPKTSKKLAASASSEALLDEHSSVNSKKPVASGSSEAPLEKATPPKVATSKPRKTKKQAEPPPEPPPSSGPPSVPIQILERSDVIPPPPSLLPSLRSEGVLSSGVLEDSETPEDSGFSEEDAADSLQEPPPPPERTLEDLEALQPQELAAFLVAHKKGQLISLPEMLAFWGYHGEITPEMRKTLTERFSSKDSPLLPDKANPFLWRLRMTPQGDLWSPEKALQRKLAREAPQEDILRLVDATFGDLQPYKRGLRLSIPEVLLYFHFPDVQGKEAFPRFEGFTAQTGWRIRFVPNPHQDALLQAAKDAIPAGSEVIKASLYLKEKRVDLAVTNPEAAASALDNEAFRTKTGFEIRILRGAAPLATAAASNLPPNPAPPNVPATPAASNLPPNPAPPNVPATSATSLLPPALEASDAPATPIDPASLGSTKPPPMEINQAFAFIKDAFRNQADRPSKLSLKGTGYDRYVEAAFLTPFVGAKYSGLFAQLEATIGWKIAPRPTPDQIGLQAFLQSKIPAAWKLQKLPSLHTEDASFSLQMAAPPDRGTLAAWSRSIEEACGYRLRF